MPVNKEYTTEQLREMKKELVPPPAPPRPTRMEMAQMKSKAIEKLLADVSQAIKDGTLRQVSPPKGDKDGDIQNLE